MVLMKRVLVIFLSMIFSTCGLAKTDATCAGMFHHNAKFSFAVAAVGMLALGFGTVPLLEGMSESKIARLFKSASLYTQQHNDSENSKKLIRAKKTLTDFYHKDLIGKYPSTQLSFQEVVETLDEVNTKELHFCHLFLLWREFKSKEVEDFLFMNGSLSFFKEHKNNRDLKRKEIQEGEKIRNLKNKADAFPF